MSVDITLPLPPYSSSQFGEQDCDCACVEIDDRCGKCASRADGGRTSLSVLRPFAEESAVEKKALGTATPAPVSSRIIAGEKATTDEKCGLGQWAERNLVDCETTGDLVIELFGRVAFQLNYHAAGRGRHFED